MIRFKSWLPLAVALPALLAGCSDSKEEESLPAAPTIEYFKADPDSIELEMYSRLAWGTRDATAVRIDALDGDQVDLGNAKAESGVVEVYPTETTVYVLTATGPGGSTKAAVSVELAKPGKPRVSLASNPADVPFGGSAVLTWSARDAFKVQLFAGENPTPIVEETEKNQGTVTISPTVTTSYRLIAEGAGGRSVVELPVGVVAAIESFGPTSEAPVAVDQLVELGWKTRGAHKLIVSNGGDFEQEIVANLDEGTIEVPASADGTFRLVAMRGSKETIATATVEVMKLPLVETFDADTPFVTDATEADPIQVTLFWDVSEVTSLALTAEPGGEIELDDAALSEGSIVVDVTGTTVFTMTGTNPVGTDSRSLTITSLPAPAIVSFIVTPLAVDAGDEVDIAWETSDGAATLEKNEGEGWEAILPDGTPALGIVSVIVDVDTEFRLTVTNAAGTKVERTESVTVNTPL